MRFCIGIVCLALAACSAEADRNSTSVADKSTATQSVKLQEPQASSEKRLRLVTHEQYLNTIAYVFGADIKPQLSFAPLPRTEGLLQIGTSKAGVSAPQLEQYQKAAALVASEVIKPLRRAYIIPCKPVDEKSADDACATQFLGKVGRLLYRKKMEPEKLAEFVGEAGSAANKFQDFYAGIAIALEAMLVSPNVFLVAERSELDPETGQHRLDAHSLASRLSYFLWNAAPDAPLLEQAERGELHTKRGLTRAIDRMIASPRLEAGVRAFFSDLYSFEDFVVLSKDAKIYPYLTGVALEDAREQTLRTVVEHLVTKNLDYRDLYTTEHTFLSPALAAFYRVPTQSHTWVPYTFPQDSPQVGVLTHVSFLALHSHPGRSSATLRGKAVRELLLCQKVPPPPPNVDFSALENPPANLHTARDRVSFHLNNPVCAGCHKITDPTGLALENFDGAGRHREDESGTLIDASGSLDGREFKDVRGLAQALRNHPGLTSCLVQRLYSYSIVSATGRDDRELLSYLQADFAANGYRVPDLMRTISASAAFRRVAE